MNTTDTSARWNTDGKWHDMAATQKMAFLGKLVIALCTWCFVFPNLLD